MGGRLFDWLGAGVAADRPADIDMPALLVSPGSTAFYFATDTKILSVFDESGPSWFDIDAAALAAIAFLTLPDVDATGLADGQLFKWDATASKMIPFTLPTIFDAEAVQDIVGAMVVNGIGTTGSYDDTAGTFKFDSIITQYTDEAAQDAIAAALAAGAHTGLTIVYDDVNNKFNFTVTVTQYTDEMAQDAIGAAIAAGTQSGLTVTYDDAGNKISYALVVAAAADLWTGTNNVKAVTAKAFMDSAAPVAVAYAAAVTLDGNTGFNFEIDLTGNITMNAPTNMKAGQSGTIRFKQDATGGRVATWNAVFEFPGGAAINGVLSTAANAIDYASYIVSNTGKMRCVLSKDFKA